MNEGNSHAVHLEVVGESGIQLSEACLVHSRTALLLNKIALSVLQRGVQGLVYAVELSLCQAHVRWVHRYRPSHGCVAREQPHQLVVALALLHVYCTPIFLISHGGAIGVEESTVLQCTR